MKRLFLALLMGGAFMLSSGTASAHVYDRDDSDHPLRYVAYALHPVGMAVEYAVLRPIHWVVSRPRLSPIFGHYPDHKREEGTYFEYY